MVVGLTPLICPSLAARTRLTGRRGCTSSLFPKNFRLLFTECSNSIEHSAQTAKFLRCPVVAAARSVLFINEKRGLSYDRTNTFLYLPIFILRRECIGADADFGAGLHHDFQSGDLGGKIIFHRDDLLMQIGGGRR